jgi:hypothetical protein
MASRLLPIAQYLPAKSPLPPRAGVGPTCDAAWLTRLGALATKGTDVLNAKLQNVAPPAGAAFALNLLLHVFVFFVVLTVLYTTVISPMESKTLASQVRDKLGQGMAGAVAGVSPATAAALVAALPVLKRLQAITPTTDPVRTEHNTLVLATAWSIAAGLGLAFVVTAGVLGASRVRLGPAMAHVFAENAVLLVILGAVEAGFFLTVASKYVPVAPSVLADTAVTTLQQAFGTVAP